MSIEPVDLAARRRERLLADACSGMVARAVEHAALLARDAGGLSAPQLRDHVREFERIAGASPRRAEAAAARLLAALYEEELAARRRGKPASLSPPAGGDA